MKFVRLNATQWALTELTAQEMCIIDDALDFMSDPETDGPFYRAWPDDEECLGRMIALFTAEIPPVRELRERDRPRRKTPEIPRDHPAS